MKNQIKYSPRDIAMHNVQEAERQDTPQRMAGGIWEPGGFKTRMITDPAFANEVIDKVNRQNMGPMPFLPPAPPQQ